VTNSQYKDPSKMKVSEIFLIFSKPFFDKMPRNISLDEYQHACRICETIWNSIVMEEWPSGRVKGTLGDLKKNIKSIPFFGKEMESVIDELVETKKKIFPDILWAFEITARKDAIPYQFIVRAAIRMPDELIPKVPKRWQHLVSPDIGFEKTGDRVLH
jgi:hypothetical protein